jgi:hypothetical protein
MAKAEVSVTTNRPLEDGFTVLTRWIRSSFVGCQKDS